MPPPPRQQGAGESRQRGWGPIFPPPPPGRCRNPAHLAGGGAQGCVQGALSMQEVTQKTLLGSSRPPTVTRRCRQGHAPHTGRPGPRELRAAPQPVGSKTDPSVHSALSGPMAVTGRPMEGAGASQRSSPRGPHQLCDKSVSPRGSSEAAAASGTALQRTVLTR